MFYFPIIVNVCKFYYNFYSMHFSFTFFTLDFVAIPQRPRLTETDQSKEILEQRGEPTERTTNHENIQQKPRPIVNRTQGPIIACNQKEIFAIFIFIHHASYMRFMQSTSP